MVYVAKPIEPRFWSKVDKTSSCWLWTASVDRRGYGKIGVGRKIRAAHRVSWELANGPIPDEMCVLHRCDVPACVRPDHLFLGTQADNMRDMTQKGRHHNEYDWMRTEAHWQRQKTHCKHGHIFDEANTRITKDGHRRCRTCCAEKDKRRADERQQERLDAALKQDVLWPQR